MKYSLRLQPILWWGLIILLAGGCQFKVDDVGTIYSESLALPDLRSQDENGNANHLNAFVTMEGIVTVASGEFDAERFKIHLQEDNQGLAVFCNDAPAKADIKRGDRLQITGALRQGSRISDEQIEDVGTVTLDITVGKIVIVSEGNPLPDPQEITVTEYLAAGNNYEGNLIRFSQVFLAEGAWPASADDARELTLGQADGSRVNMVIPKPAVGAGLDAKVAGLSDTFSVIGLARQNDATDDGDLLDGFQIWIRNAEDIVDAE